MPFYDSSELLPGGCALYADYVAIYFSELPAVLCLGTGFALEWWISNKASGKDGFLCKSTAGVAGSGFFFQKKVFNLDLFLVY